MDDKKDIFSPKFIAKYGFPILVLIYFLVSLLSSPQVTKEQLEAEGSSAVAVEQSYQAGMEQVPESVEMSGSETISEPDDSSSAVDGKTIFAPSSEQQEALKKAEETVTQDGEYSSMAETAAYIHLYGGLPSNFISKTKAKNQGWIQNEGNLGEVLPGKSIGGSRFYNDDGVLPEKEGRTYTECDIDYKGGKRNAKRIVFSDDGLVFYTEDHYETYIQLY